MMVIDWFVKKFEPLFVFVYLITNSEKLEAADNEDY